MHLRLLAICLIIEAIHFTNVFCEESENKLKVGFDFSNNLCFVENSNYDYTPAYGYDIGLNMGFRLTKKTFLYAGLSNMRFSFNFQSEYSTLFYDDLEGIPPFNMIQRTDFLYFRIPVTFKTD